MQLVAYGAQDIYLTGNPQITFFKVVYRRHTNFSMECIQQTIQGTSSIGASSGTGTVTVSRNGDLVCGMHVASSSLNIHHGDELIKEVVLEIGGQRIDKHNTEWMQIWTELSTPKSKKTGLSFMTAVAAHHSAASAADRGLYGCGSVIIPLQFWFCRNPGLALPLIALQYHEVKVKFTWQNTTDLSLLTSGSSLEVWADYVYLDTDERRRFAQVSHEYLIEQVQHSSIGASGSNTNIKLNFNHPVKELIWTDANGVYYDNAKLQLNGHDRFAKQPPEYFQLKQVSDYHTSVPSQNFPVPGAPTLQFRHAINGEGLVADIDQGLDATAATTMLEFNLFVTSDSDESAANAGHHRFLPSEDAFSGTDSTVRTDVIKAATFSAQGSKAASRFLAVNATNASNPFSQPGLAVGGIYDTHINDADGGSHDTTNNRIVALYKRKDDTTVAVGTGCVARYTDGTHNRENILTEMTNTSIKAGMVVAEFTKDLINGDESLNSLSAINLADGDTLKLNAHSKVAGTTKVRTTANYVSTIGGDGTSLRKKINVYSFALKPEEHQPSGTCNFSRIDTAKLMFDTSPGGEINIYAVNYNVLRIMSGMGGLAYSN